jgi:hypothetical protein
MFYDTGKGYSTFFFNLSEEAEIEYWGFERAREFVRPLMFASKYEYIVYSYHSYQQRRYGGDNFINRNNVECPMKPAEIPDDLIRYYKDEWTDYKDFFLGEELLNSKLICYWSPEAYVKGKIYYKYEEACKYVQQLEFKTIEEYTYWETKSKKPRYERNNIKVTLPSGRVVPARPAFLPIVPDHVYHDYWICIQEYIGLPYTSQTMYRRKAGSGQLKNKNCFKFQNYASYSEAREFVRACKLLNVREYDRYRDHYKVSTEPFVTLSGMTLPKFPNFLPSRPLEYYKKYCKTKHTWVSWHDFLGITYNQHHDQELEEMMQKASHVYYRSVNSWKIENDLKGRGYRLESFINTKIRNNEWLGWTETLNRRNSNDKCTFQEAKTLLSFKGLSSIDDYNKWRRKVGSPFFLPVLAGDEHLTIMYPNEPNTSVSNFLSIDLGDKIETQAKAVPVLAITVVKDQHIQVSVVKPGKFEAFIQYHNNPSSYIFDFYDKNVLTHILDRHCEHAYGGNIYYVKHMGYLYQDLTNNFRLMNLARIYD